MDIDGVTQLPLKHNLRIILPWERTIEDNSPTVAATLEQVDVTRQRQLLPFFHLGQKHLLHFGDGIAAFAVGGGDHQGDVVSVLHAINIVLGVGDVVSAVNNQRVRSVVHLTDTEETMSDSCLQLNSGNRHEQQR